MGPDLGESEYETYDGFIERFVSPSLPDNDYKITYNVEFILNLGDDVIFLMENKEVDFGSPQYFGKKARLSGLVYTIDNEKLMDTEDILVLPSPLTEEKIKEMPQEEEAPLISETPEAVTEGNLAAIAEVIKKTIDKKVTKFEFVEPNYVYVYYENTDGSEKRSELLTYEVSGEGEVSTTQIGLFKPGTQRDWEIISGENPIAKMERTVISVSDDVLAQVTTVKEGFRYLESKPLKFRIQYPSNWYYARSGNGYAFSDQPVSDSNVLLTLRITRSGGEEVIPRFLGINKLSGGKVSISYQDSTGTVYDIIGAEKYTDLISKMIQTVEIVE